MIRELTPGWTLGRDQFGQCLANGLAGNVADVLASDAEVGKFAVRHAAEFGNGLAILDPVVVSARNVHFHFPFDLASGPD